MFISQTGAKFGVSMEMIAVTRRGSSKNEDSKEGGFADPRCMGVGCWLCRLGVSAFCDIEGKDRKQGA